MVYDDNTFGSCGAVIIDTQWVLSAAHCVDAPNLVGLVLHTSDHSAYDATDHDEGFAATLFGNGYNSDTKENDIAMIGIHPEYHLDFSREGTGPICLPQQGQEWEPGTTATVSGWGALSYGGGAPDILQTVDISLISNEECINYYGASITDDMICAYDGPGTDSCQGDSGGPMVCPSVRYQPTLRQMSKPPSVTMNAGIAR